MLDIKILGAGCTNCANLEKLCRQVIAENAIEANILKVTDFREIATYGIMNTPGLVINGKVVLSGKLPTKSILVLWIMNALAEKETK
jgi:small redox-active disulfide protein 2